MAQKKSRQFSPEFRETAAREVVEKSGPVADVARDCGVADQMIRNWVKQFQRTHSAADTALSLPERARMKELERRVRELEEENRFLGNRWPSSRRSTGSGQILVHRGRRRQSFRVRHVPLGESCPLGIL
ncbi:transposase [Nocardia fluminea]|uniref:transposase n=1 Tax=Nocardia fluminea TaxID=134984 RepID=UPI00342015FC